MALWGTIRRRSPESEGYPFVDSAKYRDPGAPQLILRPRGADCPVPALSECDAKGDTIAFLSHDQSHCFWAPEFGALLQLPVEARDSVDRTDVNHGPKRATRPLSESIECYGSIKFIRDRRSPSPHRNLVATIPATPRLICQGSEGRGGGFSPFLYRQ